MKKEFVYLILITCTLFQNCVSGQAQKNEIVAENFVENNGLKQNPVGYYMGSSFGDYFQTLYKMDKFDEMLEVTSEKSIQEHGVEKILEFYKNMDFAYELGVCTSFVENKDGTITLIYARGEKNATNYKTNIKLEREGDGYKVILPSELKNGIN